MSLLPPSGRGGGLETGTNSWRMFETRRYTVEASAVRTSLIFCPTKQFIFYAAVGIRISLIIKLKTITYPNLTKRTYLFNFEYVLCRKIVFGFQQFADWDCISSKVPLLLCSKRTVSRDVSSVVLYLMTPVTKRYFLHAPPFFVKLDKHRWNGRGGWLFFIKFGWQIN